MIDDVLQFAVTQIIIHFWKYGRFYTFTHFTSLRNAEFAAKKCIY